MKEPQNSSKGISRIQRGAGVFDHTGETYFHGGVIDYPIVPVSEIHLDKFPDATEFESWKVNYKTEVCSKTADPNLTMQWMARGLVAQKVHFRAL